MCEGDKNTTYFHIVVNSKKCINRILSINNSDGQIVEGEQMAEDFVDHFENFLGRAENVDHIDYVGDIFTTTLTDDEAVDMIRDVTDNEIKKAMFDIDNCKALGPNGYTACFFKKARSIVGKDVCSSIKEFFSSGKLLKEANSTIIALIPKVNNPKKSE